MKKWILLVCMVLLCTGCAWGETQSNVPDTTAEPAPVVRYLNTDPAAEDTWKELASQYTRRTGIKVEVTTMVAPSLEPLLTGADAPTVFHVLVPGNGESFVDHCLDLTGTALDQSVEAEEFILREDGKIYGISYQTNLCGLLVNTTLLEKAGFFYEEIRDFASLSFIVGDIHSRAGELGFDAFQADTPAGAFDYLANVPLYYEFRDHGFDGHPKNIGGTYLPAIKNFWDLYLSASPENSATDCVFSLGSQADMTVEHVMLPVYCGVDGEVDQGLCVEYMDTWCVNKNARQADIDASIAFLHWLWTSEEGKAAIDDFGGLSLSQYVRQQAAGNAPYLMTWACSEIPHFSQWKKTVSSALESYEHGGSWDAVENAFISGWQSSHSE